MSGVVKRLRKIQAKRKILRLVELQENNKEEKVQDLSIKGMIVEMGQMYIPILHHKMRGTKTTK